MKELDSFYVRTAWKIMDALHQAQQTADGLADCLNVLCEAFSCEQGSVWVLSRNREYVQAIAQRGQTNLNGLRLAVGMGVTGQTAATGDSLLTDLAAWGKQFSVEEREAGFPEGGLLWVPIKTPGSILGCIQLGGRDSGVFSEEDLRICERCGAIIALDLEDRGVDALPDADQRVIASLKKAVKDYAVGDGILHVLKEVSLDVYENEFLVILGESGSGKSTLLNVLGCMTPLTSGCLELDGRDFSAPSENELTEYRRNAVGVIFQAYNLMPNLTAWENVQIISEISGDGMDPGEALKMVGLYDRADHLPSALSGGQQQRVAIARAIAKKPRMILADEPTAALDYETGKEVLTVLQDVVKRCGTTLVVVTHNSEIAKIADRVIWVKDGKISGIRINPAPKQASELVW